MPSKKKRSRKQKDKKGSKSNVEDAVYKILPPQDEFQAIIRRCFGRVYAESIKKPHCTICGDTEEDSRLLNIKATNGNIILCVDCYDIQIAM